MFQPLYSFPGKTPADVASMICAAKMKGLHKIAAAIVENYPVSTSGEDGNEFTRIIHDRSCGSNTLF
jgi:hypothetical protein